jgi:flagellar basal body-associated protein FliL
MNKKYKIIGFSIVTIIILAIAGYYYVMHGGARNVSNEETAFTISSKNISDEFATNVDASNKKYLDKAIAITGIVTNVNGKEVILDNSIICNLKEVDATIQKDQKVTLKGRLVGYDDLIGEIKLDQCFKAL